MERGIKIKVFLNIKYEANVHTNMWLHVFSLLAVWIYIDAIFVILQSGAQIPGLKSPLGWAKAAKSLRS